MTASKKAERLGFLDGLRGWGAVVVLFYHLVDRFLADSHPWLAPTFTKFLMDGPFAVFVFFVISGYALSHANLDPARRDLQLATISRYFRLALPILVTTFLGYLMLKAGLMVNLEVSREMNVSPTWLGTFYTFEASIYGFLKFSLFNVFFNYGAVTYNSSLWTIPFEFFGSLAIYGYLAVFRADERPRWFIALIAFLICLKIAPIYACFIGGYLAAEARYSLHVRAEWKWVVELLAILAFYAVALVITFARPPGFGSLATLATVLVIAVSNSRYLKAFFSNRLSSFLGKISFPLYLCHIFIICSWSAFLFEWLSGSELSVSVQIATNIVSTFTISFVCAIMLVPVERLSVRNSKRMASFILGRR